MTDNEIIKAWEKYVYPTDSIGQKLYPVVVKCPRELAEHTLDLIKRLQAENDNLFFTLSGAMHFVDKWLDGDELNQGEVNRAMTMREKTLEITERQAEQIEALISGQETLQKCIAEKDDKIELLEEMVDHLIEMEDA